MTSAANARHARPRARTLRRAGGRTVAVLGFAALTWAGLTGTAMAQDGGEQPGAPLGDAVGSLTDDAVRGLTDTADAVTSGTVTQSQPPAVVEPAEGTPAQVGQAEDGSTQVGQAQDAQAGSLGSAGLLDSTVHGLTTYAVPQSSTTQPADDPATATQPVPAQAPSGGLSILGLVGGAEGAVNDLTGTVLTAAQLDQTLSAPKVHVLTNTLDALAVSDALPTVPLSPAISEPVNKLLGTLPAGVPTGVVPALTDLSGGLVTPLPVPSTGAGLPAPQSPATVSPQSDPAMVGAVPALPILLPFETFPELDPSASPATFASLADGGTSGTVQDDVHLSRSLLETSDDDAGESSIPLPSGPHSPAGGPDGGSGSSHQQGGRLSSFTLPGGGLVSLVRDYRWQLPATPTSDPGFSPD